MNTNKKVFKNLKVVELSSVLAGPLTGTFFAELGADVTKYENIKTNGDVTRKWRVNDKDNGSISAYYACANYGKETIQIDLRNEDHLRQLKEKVRVADLLIVNLKLTSMEDLGLTYSELKKENPNLIYGWISGYGSSSPRVAYDVVLQAETGFMSMNGTPESGPLRLPVAMIDMMAAHQLKQGLLTALYHRQVTGEGSQVNVSLYDAAVSSLINQATNWLIAGREAGLEGSPHPNIAPYGEVFTTMDGQQIVLAIGANAHFEKLAIILNKKTLSNDPLYKDNPLRVLNRLGLQKELQALIGQWKSVELIDRLVAEGVPAGLVRSISEVLSDDQTKRLILKENQEGTETQRLQSVVFELESAND